MKKFILLIAVLFLISFIGCSAKENTEPEIKVEVKLSNLTNEEYSGTQGSRKKFHSVPKEHFRKLSVNVKIINSKNTTERDIQIPKLHIGQIVITATILYHPCHLFYHRSPRNLPHIANVFTNEYKKPYRLTF